MFRFGFLFFLGFSCLFLCEGAVVPQSNGASMTLIPGSTEKIVWSFTHDIKSYSYRLWLFIPSDGQPEVGLAKINGDGEVNILTTSYEVAVEKPATLVLKNVNLTCNGTYQFSLSGASPSEVVVYIAVKPNATASPNPIRVNESDNVLCACQGQGGNPPADVTWYKDNHKISETGKEEKTLTLTNVINDKDHKGYKCVAQSHSNEAFRDEVTVEVIVNYKPRDTKIEMRGEAYVGEKLVINCASEGFPAPSFTITHNITNIVSNHSNYIKDNVNYSDAGLYECIAKNLLGSDTKSGKLIVKVRTKDNGGGSAGLSTGAIAGICVAVVLLLVIVIIVVYMCRWYTRKEKDGRNRRNEYNEESVEVDGAYETLVPVASGSKSSAPKKVTPPPVYAAVDKDNRQGNPLYASLDTDAMKLKRKSKKRPADCAPQTDYASIDIKKTLKAAKTAKAAKAEPV